MIDITHKSFTLRYARATAEVKVSDPKTISLVKENRIPKGNVLESARVAGLFGIKKTSEMIPDCHPLPIEHSKLEFELNQDSILIEVEVETIYKTGVEVEAMHGASVAALTIYDMLKPVDKGVTIREIKLEEKKGGKSSYKEELQKGVNAAVIVCSDTISAGQKEDKAGKKVMEILEKYSVPVENYTVIPDEKDEIVKSVKSLVEKGVRLILTSGGTGLSVRDQTPEAIEPLLERHIPGIAEAMRKYGQDRMPYAMLSRSVAGTIGESLIITLPGSTKGAEESMTAIMPHVLHIFKIFRGGQH